MRILDRLRAWLRAACVTPAKAATTTSTAAVLVATAAFVAPWEGERLEAYLDRVASPPVWTVCYGETKGVQPGDRYTAAQCQQMLMQSLSGYHAALVGCLPDLPQQPVDIQIALTSWAYNVGPGAACASTLVRKARAGDWFGACMELPRWNRSGPNVVRGLALRRADEQRLCLGALP